MTVDPLTPFADFGTIDALFDVPRVTGLAVGPTGRLVATVQHPDEHGGQYVTALWELDPDGQAPPQRLTFSTKGEAAARFAPDGSLLFTSGRPDPANPKDDGPSALWRLPERGEASVVATAPGGVAIAGIADDGTVLASTAVLAGGSLGNDAERRRARKDGKVSAILHTGMPIRFWDREVGDTSPRLVLVSADGTLTDLAPTADTLNLMNTSAAITGDGRAVLCTWTTRRQGGESATSLVRIDTASKRRRILLRGNASENFHGPVISSDGSTVAVTRVSVSTPHDTNYDFLELHRLDSAEVTPVGVGDLTIGEYTFSPDGHTLYVAGDLHSRGAILAVDAGTGKVRKTIADDAAYSSLQPSPDGKYLYALRSTVGSPARPVRLTLRRTTPPVMIPAPGAIGDLPGTLDWVSTTVDGVDVGGWLCSPAGASTKKPAPLMVWIHGGPHGSYNSWSWRWCPWLFVARGYAVLMPDPAMSTGYGHSGLNRGWPRRASVVWREVEALTDHVLARRRTLDGTRTALLGASFGGFMTNWIAGHSNRFRAIVTHAGLYALDQQHPTTDAAAHKVRVHGTPDSNAEEFRANSPHHHVGNITTPMLITHGVRDYRVPISEALRLWWDLVSQWRGRPETMPHRLLQFTSENHWILSPNNSRVWAHTVSGFCDQHVLGADPLPDTLYERPLPSTTTP